MEKQVQQKDALPLNEEGNIHKEENRNNHVGNTITPKHPFLEELRKIKKSERKFRRIFEDSMDGLLLWNNQFQIVDLNSSAEEMFGLSKDLLIGKHLFGLLGETEKNKEIIKHIEHVMGKGKHSSTIIIETEEGQKRYFDYSSKWEIVEGLNFTVIKEITEKMEIQEQLRKSDTLNVIGELAAGIAHEIRNPMTALKGFIQLLEGSIRSEHELYYQVITSELQRIDSIINEFLILAKPQAIRYQEKDIKRIMKETVDLLNAQAVLHNVQFMTNYENNLPLIFCEPNQLKKVFINIIKNAIEVMPEGGIVLIKINQTKNNQIRISIRDEGMGIPKEKIKKLGEPFYTTKERGTGLGLMVSYRIIEEHQGAIHIESEIGKGTTFTITLPFLVNS
ncbi:ATP-binding protein [Neobacillus niacini]|uniref:PAS domain-containing sensor histidine kinase n=1 Tax=Neobacillus niacini TaxID=86668 RepID=UPI00285D2E26|nr:ATP-binding protein [Neobacillus niacini]MDR7002332.1 two-component system, sporulation sensor kinase E [Neobacillus niacini]